MSYYLLSLLAVTMGIAVIEDIRRFKIPNWVTYPTMLLALLAHAVAGGLDGFLFSAGGVATGIGLFIIPYLMGGMGAGDAKLMGRCSYECTPTDYVEKHHTERMCAYN